MADNALGCEIVAAARGWLGTRFHHQGRLKATARQRGGVDCLGLLVGVAQELGLRSRAKGAVSLTALDNREYGHLPDGGVLREVLEAHLLPVTAGGWRAGDVLLMRFDKAPQHLAIVTDYPEGGLGIVHALATARRVVEHPLDAEWRGKVEQGYRVVAC